MPTSKQTVVLGFQDSLGNPLTGGTVTFDLNVDISTATALGPQINARQTASAICDSNGVITVKLWPNDVLVPSGSVYFVQAYTSLGQPVWRGELKVASSGVTDYLLQEDGISVFLLETSLVDAIILET